MQMTGAKILMECLLEQGVDTIFGYPGGTILNVYDELYSYGEQIRHVLTAHEQGACHAADGYARSTGKVGVCFATSGPGCTNLVTGIATAYMDSSPIVCITCNVTTDMIGKDSFQEVDITGVTMPITKCNFLVRSVDELADTIDFAAFTDEKFGYKTPLSYEEWLEENHYHKIDKAITERLYAQELAYLEANKKRTLKEITTRRIAEFKAAVGKYVGL